MTRIALSYPFLSVVVAVTVHEERPGCSLDPSRRLTDTRAIQYNSYMLTNEMKIMFKVWLDREGKAFGDGPDKLLRRIEAVGSLHRAAADIKMSYRKAWLMLRGVEQHLGYPLLDRKVGGVSGGGSRLTPEARDLMERYEAFKKEVEAALQQIYAKHFG